MADFSRLPYATTVDVKPFIAHAPEEKLQHLRQLLRLSPVGPPVYENTACGRHFGIERDWLLHAREAWLRDFDWRRVEARINSFPNFIASGIRDGDGGATFDVHFVGLFSQRRDAVPVVFLHGWPASFASFLDVLDLLRERYGTAPASLPYHVVVPSLPGYAYSSGAPLDRDWGRAGDVARVVDGLMRGLGLDGYVAQGGDLGSFVARMLAATSGACRGMHLNMMVGGPDDCEGPSLEEDGEEEEEEEEDDGQDAVARERAAEMVDTGYAFALAQGTRPATMGLVLGASPLALLAWLGEKMLAWADGEAGLPLEKVLETTTLYWVTDTAARSLYHNRFLLAGPVDEAAEKGEKGEKEKRPAIARLSGVATQMEDLRRRGQMPYVGKPSGYSLFAGDIVPVPRRWAARTCNLVSFRHHPTGGHFAPVERPGELLDDVEAFIDEVWGVRKGGKGEAGV